MKVSGNSPMNIGKIYSQNMARASSGSEQASKQYDSIEISKEGQEISRYVNMTKEVSDVRMQKVNDIKDRVQKGLYRVSSEDLAAEILKTIKEGK